MRFWLSWIQPYEDYRPLTDPPHKAVIGWWCSGFDASDQAILCALVVAPSEDAAKAAIGESWPETKALEDWRFCESKRCGWLPGDRFPLTAWERKRASERECGGEHEGECEVSEFN